MLEKIIGGAKEVGKRVTFYDLVEDNSGVCKVIDNYVIQKPDDKKFHPTYRKVNYTIRNLARGGFRVVGDLWLALGATATVKDPENFLLYGSIGTLMFSAFYLLDYVLYDRMFPSPIKELKAQPKE